MVQITLKPTRHASQRQHLRDKGSTPLDGDIPR